MFDVRRLIHEVSRSERLPVDECQGIPDVTAGETNHHPHPAIRITDTRTPASFNTRRNAPASSGVPGLFRNPSGEPCSGGGDDFAVYEGRIGDYSSHAPVTCSTGGARTRTFGDEVMHRSPWSPKRQEPTCKLSVRMLDGFFVIPDDEQHGGDRVTFRGHGVYGWDPVAAFYKMCGFDSIGGPGGRSVAVVCAVRCT